MPYNCYCGCATWQNRVKWSMSLVFLGVGGGIWVVASTLFAIKMLNCEQNELTPQEREECVESPPPPGGWEKHCLDVQDKLVACMGEELFQAVALQLISYFFLFAAVVLLCMMCCCTERPMVQNHHQYTPVAAAVAEAVENDGDDVGMMHVADQASEVSLEAVDSEPCDQPLLVPL